MQANTYRPVVIHVAQLVGQALHVVRLEGTVVVDDVVVSWRHTACSDGLAHDEEVVPVREGRKAISARVSQLHCEQVSPLLPLSLA